MPSLAAKQPFRFAQSFRRLSGIARVLCEATLGDETGI